MPIIDDSHGGYIVTDDHGREVGRAATWSDALHIRNERAPDINDLTGQYASGCLGELVKLIVKIPFMILLVVIKPMFRFKWSLVIWPAILLLYVVLLAAGAGSNGASVPLAILLIIVGTIITYVAMIVTGTTRWIRKRSKDSQAEGAEARRLSNS